MNININIKPLTGAEFTLSVDPGESIDSLKQKIEPLASIPKDQQVLHIKGRQIGGGILADYAIKEGDYVNIRP